MTNPTMRRALAVLGACAAVTAPALASAKPGADRAKGKQHRTAKPNPFVMYSFKGTVASVTATTVAVKVRNVNRHGRALRGTEVAFDVSAARLVARDRNGDGTVDLSDVAVDDRVHVLARLPKRHTGALGTVTAKALKVHAAKPAPPAPPPAPQPEPPPPAAS